MAWRFIDADMNLGPVAAMIKAQGIDGVLRYTKNLTVREIEQLQEAGLMIGMIFEIGGANALGGANTGAVDGAKAESQLRALGVPETVPVFATVDSDVTAENLDAVESYFEAFDDAVGAVRNIGGYADGTALTQLRSDGLEYLWLAGAMGWDGSRAFAATKNYDLVQGPTMVHGGAWPPPNLIPGISSVWWPNLGFPYDPNLAMNIKWAWIPPSLAAKPAAGTGA